MTKEEFKEKTGREPENEDLERASCTQAGAYGHRCCGWCKDCDKPKFECGCLSKPEPESTSIRIDSKRILELGRLEETLAALGEARLKLRDLLKAGGGLQWDGETVTPPTPETSLAYRAVDDEMHEVLILAVELAQKYRDLKK